VGLLRIITMNNYGNSPRKSKTDIIPAHDPVNLNRIKFSLLPDRAKQRLNQIAEDANAYDRWFDNLNEEDQDEEYDRFFLDGEGREILRTRFQMMEDKAIRMRYIRVIEKLKREGKLSKTYRLK
jgi:hypothetical protein